MITIRMPKDLLKKWLDALRGGEYKQSTHVLERTLEDGSKAYCCLGVLQHCITGEVEKTESGNSQVLPTKEWLNRHNIEFLKTACRYSYGFASPLLPPLGDCGTEAIDATEANDGGRFNFKDIADAIEECAEGV
jgi:hypothetical protein